MDFIRARPRCYSTIFPNTSIGYQNGAFSYIHCSTGTTRNAPYVLSRLDSILELCRIFPIGYKVCTFHYVHGVAHLQPFFKQLDNAPRNKHYLRKRDKLVSYEGHMKLMRYFLTSAQIDRLFVRPQDCRTHT